jgi:hypothetical protein
MNPPSRAPQAAHLHHRDDLFIAYIPQDVKHPLLAARHTQPPAHQLRHLFTLLPCLGVIVSV